MKVRELQATDREAWLAMRAALWPDCPREEHVTEMHEYLSAGGKLVTFVASADDGVLCGFVEASLRPYAEGCTTKSVGYIEGIFVKPEFRRRGVARLLVGAVERWAAGNGSVELASDCTADNAVSLEFHRSVGFDVTKRLIHFRREISRASIEENYEEREGREDPSRTA